MRLVLELPALALLQFPLPAFRNKVVKMVVQCPKCEKKYKIDFSKVTKKGAKITCSNCGLAFIVRKKPKEEKEDFVPHGNYGEPSTVDLDTDKPICERGKIPEEEKAARFQPIIEDKEAGLYLARVLDLVSDGGVSFDDLSGEDFHQEEFLANVPPDQGKERLPPEEKSASFPEPQLPKPAPPGKAAQPSKPSGPPPVAAPETVKGDNHKEAFYNNILDALARGGIWRGRFTYKKKNGPLYKAETEEAKSSRSILVSLIMIIAAETRKPKMKWYSPLAFLTDRANDGFLSIARNAGKAAHFVQSGTMGGLKKIGHGLSRKKKEEKSERTNRTRELRISAPTHETPGERKRSSTGVKAESDVERLTHEELIGIIDEATKESGINIRKLMKKLE